MPWDPSDPKDPYLPKPTDPTEPTNPENPDIEKEETYMRVEAKVLQWNLVSRDVILEYYQYWIANKFRQQFLT